MTALEFGAVVLARVPYADQQQTKRRPAVVVSSAKLHRNHGDVVLLSITGQMKPSPSFVGLEIADWRQAGLLKSSMFKPALFTLIPSGIERIFGELSLRDAARLKRLLAEMLVFS
jgi:mRNA interferase MazF